MIIIFWTGLGYLVLVITFAVSLLFNLAFNLWWAAGYYDTHRWPPALSFLVSATILWFLGTSLRQRGSRIVIDKETGKEIELVLNDHRFFFIPMHWWAPLLVVGALVMIVMDLSP